MSNKLTIKGEWVDNVEYEPRDSDGYVSENAICMFRINNIYLAGIWDSTRGGYNYLASSFIIDDFEFGAPSFSKHLDTLDEAKAWVEEQLGAT